MKTQKKREFGDILDEWEGKKKTSSEKNTKKEKKTPRKNIMEIALEKYDINEEIIQNKKDNKENYENQNLKNAILRKQVLDMPPQAKIDLHGMTISEATRALDIFFENSKRQGLKKILIVHGKGIHSKEEPILKKFVKRYLEQQKLAGESGHSKRTEGSTGSTWVILK